MPDSRPLDVSKLKSDFVSVTIATAGPEVGMRLMQEFRDQNPNMYDYIFGEHAGGHNMQGMVITRMWRNYCLEELRKRLDEATQTQGNLPMRNFLNDMLDVIKAINNA